MQWIVDFYRDECGASNVEEFLDNVQDKKLRAKIFRDIDLLQTLGTDLKMPQAR